jgi:hypothetical protein
MTDTGERIWFNPPQFWAATRGMAAEEAEALLDRIIALAEQRDLNTLRKFDFISIGALTRRKAS